MNVCMYTDNDKNLMMLLPDVTTDEEILHLGDIISPDEDDIPDECFHAARHKPTGILNLYNARAKYNVNDIRPDTIVKGLK